MSCLTIREIMYSRLIYYYEKIKPSFALNGSRKSSVDIKKTANRFLTVIISYVYLMNRSVYSISPY